VTPGDVDSVAERVLSVRQLEAYRLYEAGMGYKRIALMLGIGPDSARDLVTRASRRIKEARHEPDVGTGAADGARGAARGAGEDGAARGA